MTIENLGDADADPGEENWKISLLKNYMININFFYNFLSQEIELDPCLRDTEKDDKC